jgi:hypothetical protein
VKKEEKEFEMKYKITTETELNSPSLSPFAEFQTAVNLLAQYPSGTSVSFTYNGQEITLYPGDTAKTAFDEFHLKRSENLIPRGLSTRRGIRACFEARKVANRR